MIKLAKCNIYGVLLSLTQHFSFNSKILPTTKGVIADILETSHTENFENVIKFLVDWKQFIAFRSFLASPLAANKLDYWKQLSINNLRMTSSYNAK